MASDGNFACEICAFRDRSTYKLNLHMIQVHRKKASTAAKFPGHVCQFCHQTFLLEGNLTRHVVQNHLKEEEEEPPIHHGDTNLQVDGAFDQGDDPPVVEVRVKPAPLEARIKPAPLEVRIKPAPLEARVKVDRAKIKRKRAPRGGSTTLEKPEKLSCGDCGRKYVRKGMLIKHQMESHGGCVPATASKAGQNSGMKSDITRRLVQLLANPASIIRNRQNKLKEYKLLKNRSGALEDVKVERQRVLVEEKPKEVQPEAGADKIVIMKAEVKQLFSCNFCKFKSKQRSLLAIHVEGVHEKPTKFLCRECRKIFNYRQTAVQHQRVAHGLDVDRVTISYICCKCNEMFESSSPLKQHMTANHP